MEKISDLSGIYESAEASPMTLDTSFVLFFLAVDIGQNYRSVTIDMVFMGIALIAVAVLPYFMAQEEHLTLGKWFAGRAVITISALALGILFKQSLGVLLPQAFGFLPFTLLILTAMLCCLIQFYNFFRFRLSN